MAASFDVVIREVEVYDGTGAAPSVADVAIAGDRIAAVGGFTGSGRETVDGRGLALAPGFIDVHTHDDLAAIKHADMAFKLQGGVTTCIVGNCGFGAAPFDAAFGPGSVLGKALGSVAEPWVGYRGYVATLERNPPGTNIGVLIGHGTARLAAMGNANRAPTPPEMAAMKATFREGLDAGALGFSSGLVYDPGRFASTDELIELATLLRGTGALYATHMSDEGAGLPNSVREAIEIGEKAGIPVQISHHKASGRTAWGKVGESLKVIEDAQRRGLDVHADQYPYTAGSTILSAVFRDGKLRGLVGDVLGSDVVVASSAKHPEWEGRSLAALADEMKCTTGEAATRVLAEDPAVTVILHVMREEDVRTVMRHPSTMIGSDGIPTLKGKPHPRLYGTFARVLGRYARDENLFSQAEAVHRMTGFSARKFGLRDRGVAKAGAIADLVLFDARRIIDRGTFEDPHRTPDGIEAVYVSGVKAVAGGKPTGARNGRVLRRGH